MVREINYSNSDEMREVYYLLVNAIPHSKIDIANTLHLLNKSEAMHQHTKESDLIDSKIYGFYGNEGLVAICGLYSLKDDFQDTDWINWFAVEVRFRELGIARQMFEFLEEKVKDREKSFLKVYTTLPDKIDFWLKFAEPCGEETDEGIKYYYFRKTI